MRRALLRAATPVVWRIPGHRGRKLHGFARAEQGSRIDLLQAAQRTPSLQRKALYLRHALDETRHAAMFWRRSSELREAEARRPFGAPHADTEDLFERLGEARFLAFVHRGEARGRAQFEIYARHFAAAGDARTEQLFAAILVDEQRHERYTRELLVELCGEAGARRELRRAALWEAWRSWRRAGRALAAMLYGAAMMVIYLVAGLVTRPLVARRRTKWGA
ncbi:MAG TPA: ferritin-like domain-containing protein [Kofleriaceae bacterium]|nr:ferritin-like domain-containing protein [Kofleriaceae bacterium]